MPIKPTDAAVCNFPDAEVSNLIDGGSVNPVLQGYQVTPGAKAMMDRFLLASASEAGICVFSVCWRYRSLEDSRQKLFELLKATKQVCGKSHNEHRRAEVIATDSVELAIKTLREVAGSAPYTAWDAEDAIDYFEVGLRTFQFSGPDHDRYYYADPLINNCYNLSSYGPGCFHAADEKRISICYNDEETGGVLMTPAEGPCYKTPGPCWWTAYPLKKDKKD